MNFVKILRTRFFNRTAPEAASGVRMLNFSWRLLNVKVTTHSCFGKSHQIPRKTNFFKGPCQRRIKTRPLECDFKKSFYLANVDIFIKLLVLKRAVQYAMALVFCNRSIIIFNKQVSVPAALGMFYKNKLSQLPEN